MTFDAQKIAAEAVEKGEDPLPAVVGQLAGYASVCWESMAGTGTFASEDARQATDSAIEWIRGHTVVRVEPGQRVVLVVDPEMGLEVAEQLTAATVQAADRALVISSDIVKAAYVVPVAGGVAIAHAPAPESGTCPAVLSVAGEHYPCRQMEQMVAGSVGHDGWAHSNPDAEAIWEG